MGEVLTTIAVTGAANATLIALLLFVGKTVFDKALETRVKLHEKELELQHKKAYLQFSRLHEEQAQILRELYEDLVVLGEKAALLALQYELDEAHPELVAPPRVPVDKDPLAWKRFLRDTLSMHEEHEEAKQLHSVAMDAIRRFRCKRIYLPPELADQVDRLLSLYIFIGSTFKDIRSRDAETLERLVSPEIVALWERSVKTTSGLLPDLEARFRDHLRGTETGERQRAA
jgi:hypothetical protein